MSIQSDFIAEGCIYTHSSNKYQLRTRLGRNVEYRLMGGPNIWRSTGSRDLDEASRYVEGLLINNGVGIDSRITLREFADRFFSRSDEFSYRKYVEGFGYFYEESYYESRQAMLENHIFPRFGDTPMRDITTFQIEMWFTSIKRKGSSDLLASATRAKVESTLSLVMDYALKKRVIDSNPCDKAHSIKVVAKRRDCLTMDEISMLFPRDTDRLLMIFGLGSNPKCRYTMRREWALMWSLYFSIMADTGFRPGEVAAMGLDSFVSECGVYVESSVDSSTKRIKHSIKTTSKGQRYKVGILSAYTMDILRLYLSERSEESSQLFSVNGGVITASTSNKHFKESMERAGIPLCGRTQYSLRHTFDTYMLSNVSNDLTEKDVQRLMGHTSYRMEYDHRTAKDLVRRLSGAKTAIDSMRG